jgi:hypothetical protein
MVLVRFWRNWVCVWKNCCMAGCICACWGSLPWQITGGWSALDPDLMFTIWGLGTLL